MFALLFRCVEEYREDTLALEMPTLRGRADYHQTAVFLREFWKESKLLGGFFLERLVCHGIPAWITS